MPRSFIVVFVHCAHATYRPPNFHETIAGDRVEFEQRKQKEKLPAAESKIHIRAAQPTALRARARAHPRGANPPTTIDQQPLFNREAGGGIKLSRFVVSKN